LKLDASNEAKEQMSMFPQADEAMKQIFCDLTSQAPGIPENNLQLFCNDYTRSMI